MKSIWIRSVLCLSMVVLGFLGSGCSQAANEQALTGQQAHERNSMGMDSQVGDS